MLIYFALSLWLLPLGVLAWIYADDMARVREYRKFRQWDDARLAARTPEEIRTDGNIACILMAGDFFPMYQEEAK